MEKSGGEVLPLSSPATEERSLGILERVRDVARVCSVAAGDHGVDEWMELLGEVTRAQAVLAAARDAAVVRLAAIEEVVTEDGVVGEQVNGLGTVCLDAGAMVSTATGTSARFGQELVDQAVTRVVRVPALHEAMLEGLLDDYKARRLASELDDVPMDLARAIVAALLGELSSASGPALQRKARTMLMRLCPDLLRKRIRRARKGVGLRRWMGEPGTDAWGGTFPSERAAVAWAAIDALARRYRLEGRYETLEQARAHALMDLVDGNSTVETVLHLTVPAGDGDVGCDAGDGDVGGDAGDVSVGGDAEDVGVAEGGDATVGGVADVGADVGDATVGGDADGGVTEGGDAASLGEHRTAAASGGQRAPAGASFLRPQPLLPRSADGPGPGRHDGGVFVGVTGGQGQSIAWFPAADLRSCTQRSPDRTGVCHVSSGALLDPGDGLATLAYRPGEALKDLVRRRDGGCRFPGCQVSARQCDLDHVVPWPHGPTSAANLICLCRRHHRIKQRHRWRVRLRADGVVEWVDPSGRHHRTEPVDQLGVTSSRFIDVGVADTGTVDLVVGIDRDVDSDGDRDVVVGIDCDRVVDRDRDRDVDRDCDLVVNSPSDPGGAADVGDGAVDVGTDVDGSTDSEDLRTSAAERWLAITVEHGVAAVVMRAASAAGVRRGGTRRTRDRSPGIVTREELAEWSRVGSTGASADTVEALRVGRSEGPWQGSHQTGGGRGHGCRVDHRFLPRLHPVEIELPAEVRPAHSPGENPAMEERPPF